MQGKERDGSCKTCMFSDKVFHGVTNTQRPFPKEFDLTYSDGLSYCLRNPPTRSGDYDIGVSFFIPIVNDDGWCGHYLRDKDDT